MGPLATLAGPLTEADLLYAAVGFLIGLCLWIAARQADLANAYRRIEEGLDAAREADNDVTDRKLRGLAGRCWKIETRLNLYQPLTFSGPDRNDEGTEDQKWN